MTPQRVQVLPRIKNLQAEKHRNPVKMHRRRFKQFMQLKKWAEMNRAPVAAEKNIKIAMELRKLFSSQFLVLSS